MCESRPILEPLDSLDAIRGWSEDLDLANCCGVPLAPSTRAERDPKLLVCHDMKGGYLDDKYSQGVVGVSETPYSIYHWHLIDTFVYFSHHLVTLPPCGWIDVAHRNGTKVLGTFITEWHQGAEICRKLLSNPTTWTAVAHQMARMMAYYGFDGWLVNIENKIEPEHTRFLLEFIALLRKECKALVRVHVLTCTYTTGVHNCCQAVLVMNLLPTLLLSCP
eukprot:m.167257 g.167257  ORF g.167257 m.167257 type:complete len:220 (-) comp14455_c0_seq6:2124-2783(-)